MFCQVCGLELQEGSVFCQNCGSAVGSGDDKDMQDATLNAPEASIQEGQTYSAPVGITPQAVVGAQVLQREADPAAVAYGGWNPNEPPAAIDYQAAQQQGCKICGGFIDSRTRKCTGCGKQYFRPKKAIIWASAIVVVAALAGLNVWQYLNSAEQKDMLAEANALTMSQKEQLQDKDTAIAEKDDTIKNQNNDIQDLQVDLDDQQATINELESEILDLEDSIEAFYYEESLYMEKANFLDDYIVIIPDDGSETYHKYGCTYCDMSTIWAYNIDAAIGMGYTPCPYCN